MFELSNATTLATANRVSSTRPTNVSQATMTKRLAGTQENKLEKLVLS